jgi:hypothetical protein
LYLLHCKTTAREDKDTQLLLSWKYQGVDQVLFVVNILVMIGNWPMTVLSVPILNPMSKQM